MLRIGRRISRTLNFNKSKRRTRGCYRGSGNTEEVILLLLDRYKLRSLF
jgi:hypothetical protein